jgi:hypothetical protein
VGAAPGSVSGKIPSRCGFPRYRLQRVTVVDRLSGHPAAMSGLASHVRPSVQCHETRCHQRVTRPWSVLSVMTVNVCWRGLIYTLASALFRWSPLVSQRLGTPPVRFSLTTRVHLDFLSGSCVSLRGLLLRFRRWLSFSASPL